MVVHAAPNEEPKRGYPCRTLGLRKFSSITGRAWSTWSDPTIIVYRGVIPPVQALQVINAFTTGKPLWGQVYLNLV